VSHFYHPTPPPRNPSGFWRGVDNLLKMRQGTLKLFLPVLPETMKLHKIPGKKLGMSWEKQLRIDLPEDG
jgi:hypothetical protein